MTSTVFALAHLDHDGDHVEYICFGTITRVWSICDALNRDRGKHEQLEPVTIPVLR